MRLIARISLKYEMKSRNDVSDWLWYNSYCKLHHERSPIIDAVMYGYLEVVRYLHENGANIHVREERPLHEAVWYNHMNIVKYLCEYGANVNAYDEYAIRVAANKGNMDMVQYLYKNGANIDKAIRNTFNSITIENLKKFVATLQT